MSRFLNARLEAMAAYVPGEQPRDQVYIKLNTNESPFPPAPAVAAAMTAREVEDLRLYSDPTGKDLKEKLAGLYGVEPENIFLCNGSDEALNFLFLAYGGRGAAYPDITYGFYAVFAQLYGIESTVIPLEDDFSIDPETYHDLNRLIVIANPNAPTGLTLGTDAIEGIVRSNPHSVVVIDEAYVDFGGESVYPLTAKYDNLVVTRTFSKSRSMAGARLGYAIGGKAVINDLEKIRYSTNPYNVNRLTMRLGEVTVENEAYYQANCAEIIRVREWTAAQLRDRGFRVLPSCANFVFAASPAIGGEELYLELKKRGVLVRHFSGPRIREFNRITIGTQSQMAAFLQAVDAIMEGRT